ncbi:VWA domain-containing protein [Blastococcus sp. CT_GayMR19]|uniref:GDSL-type esterase/lipase family protein n=1 Tax=Blastococcus sp. CT_GayMR19 TaxID=2559608 RepID=UPI001074455F|nr:GDSL-type esterase/lipase family protein [Blastococcus sp. CT_GayMR19]TFV74851.1 VWA domain-containing protein [Blastococcus sp. CT_GayMR19]
MTVLRRAVLAAAALVMATGVFVVPVSPTAAAPSDPIPLAASHPVLLVVDTSGSMGDDDVAGVQKIEGAKTGLLRLLNRLPQQTVMGLRHYPAGSGGCDTGEEVIDVAKRAPASMSAEIRTLTASGDTPTAEALQAAGEDLLRNGFTEATIIVVSDGQSTCADPCPVARKLISSGLSVTIDTIGFSLAADDPAHQELTCLSDATGGTYTPADSADSLADRLSQFGEAIVSLDAKAAGTFYPESQTELEVTATVTNSSSQLVTDVRVDLRFLPGASAGAPAVVAPLRILGNLEAGKRREVSWRVPMTTAKTQGELKYTARAISSGARPVEKGGTVKLRAGLSIDDAGKLFQDADHVVVLGDSFSSGEGGGRYEEAMGACHRSPNTYAVQLFGQARVTNLACSGAVVKDHSDPNYGRAEDGTSPLRSQRAQLKDVDDIDLVMLTMGGNDVHFADIITNCAAGVGCDGLLICTGRQIPSLKASCEAEASANPVFWEFALGDLRTQLVEYYKTVLGETGAAPVVVLPYVNVVPVDDRGANACFSGLPGVSRQELELIRWLQGELNRKIASAVAEVRDSGTADAGSRLHYAAEVETAVLPNHTICDTRDPWVVPIGEKLNGREKNELVHPTAAGYQAIAGALLRWSSRENPPPLDDSVPIPASYLNTGVNAIGGAVDGVKGWIDDRVDAVREIDLSGPLRNFTAPAGRPITLFGSGYAPGVLVTVGIASTMQTLGSAYADENGEVRLTVTVPAELGGDHTVYAAGFDPDGNYLVQGQALEVTDPPIWGSLGVGLLGALLILGGWLVVRVAWRRRQAVPDAA